MTGTRLEDRKKDNLLTYRWLNFDHQGQGLRPENSLLFLHRFLVRSYHGEQSQRKRDSLFFSQMIAVRSQGTKLKELKDRGQSTFYSARCRQIRRDEVTDGCSQIIGNTVTVVAVRSQVKRLQDKNSLFFLQEIFVRSMGKSQRTEDSLVFLQFILVRS